MKKGPFKLKSGNKPSISKLAGISPMKKDKGIKTDEDRIERSGKMLGDADKAIKKGNLKPLNPQQLKNENINKDIDTLNYYKFRGNIISRPKI
jgi:hypothetical protein